MKRKYVFLMTSVLLCVRVFAQQIPDWQHKDLQTDSVFGISTNKAYNLLKGKISRTVTVAVIDAGVDTLHEDLQSILWVNPNKKRNRKYDNGTYGWSYIGSAKGNVQYDNLELTRQVRQGDTSLKKELAKQYTEARNTAQGMGNFIRILDAMLQKIGKAKPRLTDFQDYSPTGPGETQVRQVLLEALSKKDDYQAFRETELDKPYAYYLVQAEYQLNINYDPRPLYVGDDYFNSRQHNYGSPDCMGPDAHHGTHVAGIIAAVRHNGLGLDGIADNARIMAIRAVPDGDERDKDIANAIRYAADHGAKVINMSFGKAYSQDKAAVDDAVQYALKKDVLLVQAAGNSNQNIDSTANFPRRVSADEAYIMVGASGLKGEKASFSNYGTSSVDVFAPGVQIYSSIPGSKYDFYDGTSMACPVVAGLAALIREYYPQLKAQQVKDIILQSVRPQDHLKAYCRTGGIVNAYAALTLAEKISGNN